MKNPLPALAVACTVLLSCCLTAPTAAQVNANSNDGPMPQTREHILLARQVGVPLVSTFLFDNPNPGPISPLLGLLGTGNGNQADGRVDASDFSIWRESYGSTAYPYPQVPLGWRRVSLEWD